MALSAAVARSTVARATWFGCVSGRARGPPSQHACGVAAVAGLGLQKNSAMPIVTTDTAKRRTIVAIFAGRADIALVRLRQLRRRLGAGAGPEDRHEIQ